MTPPNDLLPDDGNWPCQAAEVPAAADSAPRLTCFLYLLLRNGAPAPGDVEQLAINATDADAGMAYTNPHLEGYARSLATHLLDL